MARWPMTSEEKKAALDRAYAHLKRCGGGRPRDLGLSVSQLNALVKAGLAFVNEDTGRYEAIQ